MAAWDRQEKEPSRAYSYFTIYRDLGPERSLAKVGQIVGIAVQSVEEKATRWNWVARCDQWDAHVIALHNRAFLTETAKKARQRAQAYTALLGKSLEALKTADVSKSRLSEIAAAMKTAAEGLRLEEGLETARLSLELNDARIILARLPAEIRAGLLRALEAESRPERDPVAAGGVPVGLGSDDE